MHEIQLTQLKRTTAFLIRLVYFQFYASVYRPTRFLHCQNSLLSLLKLLHKTDRTLKFSQDPFFWELPAAQKNVDKWLSMQTDQFENVELE